MRFADVRSLLLAVLVCSSSVVSSPAAAQSALTWVDFSQAEQGILGGRVRSISLSDRPGDVQADAIAITDGRAHVAGRLSLSEGATWSTLGLEVGKGADNAQAASNSGLVSLRIGLSSNAPRMLRIRLKGTDNKVLSIGCYPVVLLQVGTSTQEYVLPLSAFESEAYCGERAVSVEKTLPDLASIEVTANEPSDEPVRFSVDRIELLSSQPGDLAQARDAKESKWNPVWADDFKRQAGRPADAAHWSVLGQMESLTGSTRVRADNAVSKAASHDGNGTLQLGFSSLTPEQLTCSGGACRQATVALQSNASFPMLYGRVEVAFKVPAMAGLGARVSLLGSPQPGRVVPEEGEILLIQTDGVASLGTVGLRGPGLDDPAYRTQVVFGSGSAGGVAEQHAVALEWEPTHLRWFVDGIPVKTLADPDLSAAAGRMLGRWPYLLNVALTARPDAGADLLDARWADAVLELEHVRVFQRADLAAAAAPVLAAWRGPSAPSAPKAVQAAKNAPPKTATRSAPAEDVQTKAAPRTAVCERHPRLGLMLCH